MLLTHRRRAAVAALLALLTLSAACSSDGAGDDGPADEGAAEERAADEDAGDEDRATGPLVFTNGAVYSMAAAAPPGESSPVEAIVVDRDYGVVLALGTEDDALDAAGADAEVIDLDGRMLLPGFHDIHLHVPEAGINEGLCFVSAEASMVAYEDALALCADDQAAADWVRAAGVPIYDLAPTSGPAVLPVDVLDRAVPDRPALVLDDLGHSVWANSRALAAAGIDDETPDPQGGVIDRDPRTGRATGLLFEDAQHLVREVAADTPDVVYDGLLDAQERLAEVGVTSVSDAGGFWNQGHDEAWLRAEEEGTLTVRAANTLYVFAGRDFDEQLAELEARFSDDPDRLVNFGGAKVYVDGTFDLGTARLLAPYDVAPDPEQPAGFDYFGPALLEDYVAALDAIGFGVSFHAIGDGAVRQALDAVEANLTAGGGGSGRPHRVTHTYLVDPDDIGRFAELGVVADFQMGLGLADYGEDPLLREWIGARADRVIPIGDLVSSGATATLSSDWDADELGPLGTIQRVLERTDQGVDDLETALRMVTVDSAVALGHADRVGTLEPGMAADLVVLDDDLFDVDIADIASVGVDLTMVAGTEVHRSPAFTG